MFKLPILRQKILLVVLLISSVLLYGYATKNRIVDFFEGHLLVNAASTSANCTTIVFPFLEGFNKNSPTIGCWDMIDVNKDGTSPTGNNLLRTHTAAFHEGDQSIYFYGATASILHDDYLISPTFNLTGGAYKITYYHKANASYKNSYDVLLSTAGKAVNQFTTVLKKVDVANNVNFEKNEIYISGITGPVNLAWHINFMGIGYFNIDTIQVESVSCTDVVDISIESTTQTSVDFTIDDVGNSQWEYIIQKKGSPAPTGAGISTATKTVTTNVEFGNVPLTANQAYEVYVRSKCGNSANFNSYYGPISFSTRCNDLPFPLHEGFDSDSSTFNCWSLLDVNNDATAPTGGNLTRISPTGSYEGNQCLYFFGNLGVQHDDYVISPTMKMTGGYYKLVYYHKSGVSNNNEFEVVLSTTGISPADFKTVLQPKAIYQKPSWTRYEILISGITGDVNIAWHINFTGSGVFYLDSVELLALNCSDVMKLTVDEVKENSVTFSFEDNGNTSWEYWIQPAGLPSPTGNGVVTTTRTVTALKDIDNNPLDDNTAYEVFVRAKCISGNTYNDYVLPVGFTTLCSTQAIPFSETFDKNSPTIGCWSIVDANNDATGPTGNGIWKPYIITPYEGDQCFYFYGLNGNLNSDYLISPGFNLDQNKIYKLSFYHKTNTTGNNLMEVVMSKTDILPSSFTKVIVPEYASNSTTYSKVEAYVTGVQGQVYFGWNMKGSGIAYSYIDSVKLEEVPCAEPLFFEVNNVKTDEVTLTWIDEVNTSWEYAIIEKDGALPSSGTAINQTTVVATKDSNGVNLTPNTAYEFYVRSKCSSEQWIGPVRFNTLCIAIGLPFIEGFDHNSTTYNCWTIIDVKKDATAANGNNIWKPTTVDLFQGDQSMMINGTINLKHDDYLISPTFTFTGGDYKLTYYYKTAATNANEYEVVLFNNGVDITKKNTILFTSGKTNSTVFEKKEIYIQNVTGSVNIGWHFTASTAGVGYLDMVSIESVACDGPNNVATSNITTNSVDISWSDIQNQVWEYAITPQGTGFPLTGGGITSNVTSVIATLDSKGMPLQSATAYDVYVRSKCASLGYSGWEGPVSFTTKCGVYVPAFTESFDSNSPTLTCWQSLDLNNDATSAIGNNLWRINAIGTYSGNGAMYFNGAANSVHNDYLVSPGFDLIQGQKYKISYRVKTAANNDNDFNLVIGDSPTSFTASNSMKLRQNVSINAANYELHTIYYVGAKTGVSYLAFEVAAKNACVIYIDDVQIVPVECEDPIDLTVTDIQANKVSLVWKDNENSSWEYYVQVEGGAALQGNGVVATSTKVAITTDFGNNPLLPQTKYEFYVRSKCSNGQYSDWQGPYFFTTACMATPMPFEEEFETTSVTKDCWTMLDGNNDATSPTGNNLWRINSFGGVTGATAYFMGAATTKQHNDYLVSPSFSLNANSKYKLTYSYKTIATATYDNSFSVMLSDTGSGTGGFKEVILPTAKYTNATYVEETIYFDNIVARDVVIGWHVTGKGAASIQIDNVKFQEVGCVAPDKEVVVSNETATSATLTWTDSDPTNLSYSFVVQLPTGSVPTATGSTVTAKTVTVSATNNGANQPLTPNTEYEFYVRSKCVGTKTSEWIGPIKFRTACSVQTLPLVERFDQNSSTLYCWTQLDEKGGRGRALGQTSTPWELSSKIKNEGDASISLTLAGDTKHSQWLLSPYFTTSATKYYRLTYSYYGNSTGNNVSVYTQGYPLGVPQTIDAGKFVDIIKAPYVQDKTQWQTSTQLFKGVDGVMILGILIETEKPSVLYFDNLKIEEVVGCPEPSDLEVTNITGTQATIGWNQEFEGTEWEYFIQYQNGAVPSGQVKGTASTTKQVVVDKDNAGKPLKNNANYEFYVRTKCGTTGFSKWSGPFKFSTDCGVFVPDFYEGFNTKDNSLKCWTILDQNKDATSSTSSNIWRSSIIEKMEGNASMEFLGANSTSHNDYLISPVLQLDPAKTYRLKYYYRTNTTTTNKNEMAVVLSQSGVSATDFKTVIVPKRVYANSAEWQLEYAYISGIGGEVNLAFHVTSVNATNFYIDQFSLEEVQNCIEPNELGVSNVKSGQADIFWTDNFGATKWEYYVQPKGQVKPRPNDKGSMALTKKVVVDRDNASRTPLLGATDYEFYVRTICNDGSYSIWQGPFYFTTSCGIYTVPFYEEFETSSISVNCWDRIDENNDGSGIVNHWFFQGSPGYESKTQALFSGGAGKTHDDYAISPTVQLDGGLYMLKYKYKTSRAGQNDFEILVSTTGKNKTSFNQVILPKQTYRASNWTEQVVFFENITGQANLAWHVTSQGSTSVGIDNVEIKKVLTCPDPYNIEMTGQTTTSIDLEWEQYGSYATWEVVLVEVGEPVTSTPIVKQIVNTTPSVTLSGLTAGKRYHAYVRTVCSTAKGETSDWSSVSEVYTTVGSNDDCSGASQYTIKPTMGLDACGDQVYHGVTKGATLSSVPHPSCFPKTMATNRNARDIWFTFVPTHAVNLFRIQNVINLDNLNPQAQKFYVALYDTTCNDIKPNMWTACLTIDTSNANGAAVDNLIPGKTYLIRVAYESSAANGHTFDLCIGTHNAEYLEVNASGDKYTVEELVKNVLVQSDCDLVSNVQYQNGDGSPTAMQYNTLGYFNRGKSDFPFEEGIVLSTNEIQYVAGPATSAGTARGNNTIRWSGDQDINDLIEDAGGAPPNVTDKRVTQVEFDFVPIKEQLQFEYLFASNSYSRECTTVGCAAGALFGAWLVDTETGKGINLAKITGTDTPIALNTIADNARINKGCTTVNPELYWKHYENNVNHKAGAAIDFVGLTQAMRSEEVDVIPGRKYHIKLAVIDFCNNPPHSSAVFFNAGSFDLGKLDLGSDLTVENQNAICGEQSKTIYSGLAQSGIDIQWYKDGVVLPGENTPDLQVTESGMYEVTAYYPEIDCEIKGEVLAEIYPSISEVVSAPNELNICRYSLVPQVVDLTKSTDSMFTNVEEENYYVTYFNREEDAMLGVNAIAAIHAFEVDLSMPTSVVYMRVEDVRTGCVELFLLKINLNEGELPEPREKVVVCESYVLPPLEDHQSYFTASGGKGTPYKAGDVLKSGEHTIFVLQNNGNDCYEEVSYQVEVVEPIKADVFEDVKLTCELYELPTLNTSLAKYFIEFNGLRYEAKAGDVIPLSNTKVIIEVQSEDGICSDTSSFTVFYEECPIPKGISPNGDNVNDRFDLSKHGVTSVKIFNRNGSEVYRFEGQYIDQWHGQDKSNKTLPSGTYYYVIDSFAKTRTGWVQINR